MRIAQHLNSASFNATNPTLSLFFSSNNVRISTSYSADPLAWEGASELDGGSYQENGLFKRTWLLWASSLPYGALQ